MLVRLIAMTLLLAGVTRAADLSGTVIAPDGKSVAGATILVHSAAPKQGVATQNASDYPDCKKSSTADALGTFTIAEVDPSLKFDLLVTGDGFRPRILKGVDSTKGEITAKLDAMPKDVDPTLLLRGHVVDAAGEPVAGARIEVSAYGDQNSRTYGGESRYIESETLTDARGDFVLIAKEAKFKYDLRFQSRNSATAIFEQNATGEEVHQFTLPVGAAVSGRLVRDGQPIDGVKMILIQQSRASRSFLGANTAMTDAQGKFTFPHVKANEPYLLSASLTSLGDRGAVQTTKCTTTDEGSVVETGDISLEPGCVVSGQLVCSDGKPIAEGTRVIMNRTNLFDSIGTAADKDGKFSFKSIPPELYMLTATVEGYHISKENVSADPSMGRYLMGLVESDTTDLRIQLDPGTPERSNIRSGVRAALQNSKISGVEGKP